MSLLSQVLFAVFYPILGAGVIMYIIQNFFGKTDPPSFEIAVICAIIGGFALSGGFLEKASSGLQRSVRQIGVLYLAATIAFVVLTMVMPMAKIETTGVTYWIIFLANLVSMIAAIGFFSYATGWLIAKLPAMFQEFWDRK